jgi:hypothetical protein
MKFFYLLLLGVVFLSCKSQQQRTETGTAESDSIVTAGEPEKRQQQVTYCENLVKEILRSSPRYKQLTGSLSESVKKNGGKVEIVLDKSPHPRQDNTLDSSASYEMQVTESYTDRRVNVARFQFNPANNQLYEYDIVRDQLITIDYDRSLLDNAGEYCK